MLRIDGDNATVAQRHAVLNPERAVLVKGGNAILGCDILGIRLVVGHLLDESQDSLFGGAVVPLWQWVLGLRTSGASDNERQHGDS